MEHLLKIEDLYVNYNTDDAVVHALNGFTLSLSKGEKLGLVGETGAGKTTMALSILRLLPDRVGEIAGGRILYNNEDILTKSGHEMREMRGAKISMIFQDPMTSLNPVLTVGDQVLEVLELHFHDMSKDEKRRRTDNMLELVGIPPARKNEFPHQFSGGMKQRIVIAMALIAEPELLLSDEPTTALDVTIQAQILDLMRQLKEEFNTAMILITHDLGVVAEFCDNIAIMYAGEIIERGTVEQIYTKANNHPYTTGLFNCIPSISSNEARLTPIPGFMPDPSNLPVGCSFAGRCTKKMDICTQKAPPMFFKDEHGIKCFLYQTKGEH